MAMMHMSRVPGRPQPGRRFAWAWVLALAFVVIGASSPGPASGTVSAQALNACALLKVDEIEQLTPNTTVNDGVAASLPAFGSVTCQYVWGVGTGRFKLDIVVNDATRIFPGMSPEQMKQRLLESVKTGTDDAVVAEIGEAAVFRPGSPVYATATALVKGHVLQLSLDGVFAGEMKDQVVGLLKSAASRL
jgi:hypothetical protein